MGSDVTLFILCTRKTKTVQETGSFSTLRILLTAPHTKPKPGVVSLPLRQVYIYVIKIMPLDPGTTQGGGHSREMLQFTVCFASAQHMRLQDTQCPRVK